MPRGGGDHTRKRNWQTNKTREKIRDSINTGLIVKRFEDHVLKDEGAVGYISLSNTQIKAGEVLLSRTMPTLSSAEIVEQHAEPGIAEAIEKLNKLVGPTVARALLSKQLQDQSITKPVTHAEPAQEQ